MAYRQNDSQRRSDSVRFDLMEHIGVLSMRDTGWTREVNIVSWNGGTAKVDIREWDPEHKRMTKGVTLFEEEAETLAKVLARRYGIRFIDKEPSRKFMTEDSLQTEDTGEIPVQVSGAAAACVAETALQMQDDTACDVDRNAQ